MSVAEGYFRKGWKVALFRISQCVVHQTVASHGGTSDFFQRASPLLVVVVVVVAAAAAADRFYTELLSTLEQTHSCRIQFWMSDCSFVQRAFEYPRKWHTYNAGCYRVVLFVIVVVWF